MKLESRSMFNPPSLSIQPHPHLFLKIRHGRKSILFLKSMLSRADGTQNKHAF
jgi:hypothetical protein